MGVRREARELVLQGLHQWDPRSGDEGRQLVEQWIEGQAGSPDQGKYSRRLLQAFWQHEVEFNRKIEWAAENWRVDRMAVVDLPIRTVGVQGDQRTYEYVVALRVVDSTDGMTADWIYLPFEILQRISSRIVNEVSGVNRVVLDISSKPPSTIEWE